MTGLSAWPVASAELDLASSAAWRMSAIVMKITNLAALVSAVERHRASTVAGLAHITKARQGLSAITCNMSKNTDAWRLES